MMRGNIGLVLLLVGCAGQSGATTSSTAQQQTNHEIAVCAYPSGIETDAGATDACVAGPPGQSCAVSNGATILPDGGVENGTKTCTPQCDSSHYELRCSSSIGSQTPLPSPASSLGCTVIAEPTPSNALFYCCPCAK
jgi:hypothetical protein